ncbi:ABC transporter permease [Candidatus Protochlamydia amoebophila]|nr:ABC transporter permease [Candidatus Protochlamydia amoebophila]
MHHHSSYTYWQTVWKQFKQNPLAIFALIVVCLFCLAGIYAPFLASSKPIVVQYEGNWYFPLFRYLFFPGFFTKPLDIFYNLLIFTLPLFIATWCLLKKRHTYRLWTFIFLCLLQIILFLGILYHNDQDPSASLELNEKRQQSIQKQLDLKKANPLLAPSFTPNWEKELSYMTPYARLNLVLRYQQRLNQDQRLKAEAHAFLTVEKMKKNESYSIASLWQQEKRHEKQEIERQQILVTQNQAVYPQAKAHINALMDKCQTSSLDHLPSWQTCKYLTKISPQEKESLLNSKNIVDTYERAQSQLNYLHDKQVWLENQIPKLKYEIMPLLRPFHWEDDAGGEQALNKHISWWELTRVNRKDMVAALIFGIRVSLSVGLLSIVIALLIGIPVGAVSGYYGGKIDIIIYRLIEIWESMPTFFMLLMIVAFLQNKSIFLVIAIIGLFGWTGFSRFIRGEFFRQKQLPYVEACHAQGFSNRYIMFSHLLPNAIPPLLTLVPFAIMGAITSETGLSFLGLGEEGSSSWGVLMDEGRTAFPSESYLLWPPATLLTILLVAIALVGDALRDALDPKLHSHDI